MHVDSSERVLFVHAHPDDESVFTGGTIAALIERGAHVTVVTCTRGERGHLDADHSSEPVSSAEARAELRSSELAAALSILGVSDHRFLGDDNARWPGNPPRRYTETETGVTGARATGDDGAAGAEADSFTAASFGEVASDIAAVISDVAPSAVVSYNEWGGSGHPDHIRAHQASRRAAEVMGVAFFAIEPEDSAATPTMTVDASTVVDRKRLAVASHASRLTVSGDSFTRANGETAPIGATESFRRIRPMPLPSGAFRDIGLVTQVATVVLVGAVSALAGLLLTAIHQSTFAIGEWSFPLGLVAAMLASTALIVGLRIVWDTRVLPAIAGGLMLAATAVLAFPTPGGSIVVPANLAGYVWSFGPAVVTLLVLAWPRVQRSAASKISGVPAVKGPSIP